MPTPRISSRLFKARPALAALLVPLLAASCAHGPAVDGRVVAEAALQQVGTPYVYGGSVPGRALDCSALTRHAYDAAGIAIPRTAAHQRAAARAVAADRLRAGDLVFFDLGPGMVHVGVMVDEERFVHAGTSAGRVQVARLDAPYWQRRFAGGGTYLR